MIVQLEGEDTYNQLEQCRTVMWSGKRIGTASVTVTASWWPWANYLSSIGIHSFLCKISDLSQRMPNGGQI